MPIPEPPPPPENEKVRLGGVELPVGFLAMIAALVAIWLWGR